MSDDQARGERKREALELLTAMLAAVTEGWDAAVIDPLRELPPDARVDALTERLLGMTDLAALLVREVGDLMDPPQPPLEVVRLIALRLARDVQ